MTFKDFIPPAILRLLRKFFKKAYAPTFASFSEAKTACDGLSYEEGELVEVIFEKTRVLKNSLPANQPPTVSAVIQQLLCSIAYLERKSTDKVAILDFGGACGAHYFMLKNCHPDLNLFYVVVETPTMVSRAREFENKELHFVTSIEEACRLFPSFDLVFTAAALQYVPDTAGYLKNLLGVKSSFMLFSRCCFSAGPDDVFLVQESDLASNGPGALPQGFSNRTLKYPLTCLSVEKFFGLLTSSYDPVLRFPENANPLDMHIKQGLTGFGLLAKNKDKPAV